MLRKMDVGGDFLVMGDCWVLVGDAGRDSGVGESVGYQAKRFLSLESCWRFMEFDSN